MDLNKLLQLNSSNISGVGSVNVTTGNSTAVAATDGQLLAWIIADGATCIIGAISNLILLLTIFVHPPLRQSSSSALIAHSIVVDLYCCTISVPVGAIILYLGPGHPQAVSFCRYLPLWVYVIYPCEAWATVMLAVHRLAATVSPIFFSKLKSRSVIVGMIVLPWVATFWVVVWQVMWNDKAWLSYALICGYILNCWFVDCSIYVWKKIYLFIFILTSLFFRTFLCQYEVRPS